MDIVARYLYAVQRALPRSVARPGDVVLEIGEDIQSQIDRREAELGRALDDAEVATIVESYGHPLIVAARYGEHRSLIGPELLPFYWRTLVTVLSIVVALELCASTVAAIVEGNPQRLYGGLGIAWDSLWIYTGVVTALFAAVERMSPGSSARFVAWIVRWDPRRLPEAGSLDVPRRASFFEALGTICMLLLLLDVGSARRLVWLAVFGPAGLAIPSSVLGPAWHPLYVCTVAATALLAPVNLLVFAQPRWRRLRDGAHLAANAAILAGIVLTSFGGALVAGQPLLDRIVHASLVIAAIAFAVALAMNLRALRSRPKPPIFTENSTPLPMA
ncbi:MAG TPA: hypothetical protein VMH02_03870 [Verrucomicrobiae bacterium]|nr:hypothetical protein [Verrucomicrobiae bacterium]